MQEKRYALLKYAHFSKTKYMEGTAKAAACPKSYPTYFVKTINNKTKKRKNASSSTITNSISVSR